MNIMVEMYGGIAFLRRSMDSYVIEATSCIASSSLGFADFPTHVCTEIFSSL